MLAESPAFSGFAVPDVPAARRYYEDTLGLRVSEANGMLTLHLAGGRDTLVYPKDDHVPAPYPAWSAIGVAELVVPGTLVEIRAIAEDPTG